MYLVGIEEWRMIDIQVLVAPRIAVGHRHLAIAVAPIAFAPVAGVVGDACMTYGTGKDVGYRLKILCHESAIRGSHTTNLLLIYIRMLFAYLLHPFDDVFGRTLTSSIHMA